VHQVGEVAVRALPDRHLKGVEGEIGPEALGDSPADDGPAEGVGDERYVAKARPCRDVGDVCQPETVRRRCLELALDEVGRLGPGVVGDRRPLELAPAHTTKPEGGHEPGDPVTADVDALPLQLGPDLVDAVNVVVLAVHPGDLRAELGVPDRPW